MIRLFLIGFCFIFMYANTASAQDMSLRYTCNVPGFKNPLLFSALGNGKGIFNNVEVFARVVKDPGGKSNYNIVHFIEWTATGNMTTTTIFHLKGAATHRVVHSRHILLDKPIPSQNVGECILS